VNETRVFALTAAQAEQLAERLRGGLGTDAEWRRVDHARFAVKAEGVNLVCYTSGKVVVQGRDLADFCARYLDDAAAADRAATPPPVAFDGPTIGSDEAGKGDYFGPLVVAAVFAEPASAAALKDMGVADSKSLADRRMFPMAERIETTLDSEVRVLAPADYNARWAADPNVNHLLAELHADAIAALLGRHPGSTVVVDRFGDEQLIARRLQQRKTEPARLVVAPRAEAHAVVAAASIVARVHFLEGLRRSGEVAARELPKGASAEVDDAGRQVLRDGGEGLLWQVAKRHFRNSERVLGGRS
jgi:ribonuclease HIII